MADTDNPLNLSSSNDPAVSSARTSVSTAEAAFVGLAFLIPLALVLIVYWPYLRDAFVWDDWVWIRAIDNRSLLSVIRRGFSFSTRTEFDFGTPFFRPATDIAFKFEMMAFGLNATPYHLVNFGLHIASCGLGALIVSRMTRSWVIGLATASIFAVYPAQEIAVAWISQLAELLGAAAALASMASFQRYLMASSQTRSRVWFSACFLAMAIAALAKESQVASIALLPPLVFLTPGRQRTNREVLVAVAILGGVLGGYGLFHVIHQWIDPEVGNAYRLGWHIPGNTIDYVRWLAFPFAPDASWAGTLRTLGAVSFLAAGVYTLVAGQRVLAFLFLWTLLWVIPFTLFEGPIQYRYAYLSSLPFLAFVMTGVVELARAVRLDGSTPVRATAAAFFVVLLVASGSEIRDRQALLHNQSILSEALLTRVREECGRTTPGGTVAILGYPLVDPFGLTVRSAVDTYLGNVHVTTVASDAANADCVVRNPAAR